MPSVVVADSGTGALARVRLGVNPIGWSNDDDRSLGGDIALERCLGEAHAAGYSGIEKGHKFPDAAPAMRAALAPHGLRLVSAWHSLGLLGRTVAAELEAIDAHLELLAAMGCEVCIVCETTGAVHGVPAAPLSARPVLGDREWPGFARALDEVAARVAARGMTLVYHHHMGTVVQGRDEIDALLRHCGERVTLLLDTGHALFAGADPAGLAATHGARVRHVHCKNVRPGVLCDARAGDWSFLEAVRAGVFTVPGDAEGAVDFAAVLAAMASHGYRGWLVVEAEQDPRRADPLVYASLGARSLAALARTAGFAIG